MPEQISHNPNEASRFTAMKKEIEAHGELPDFANSTEEDRNKKLGLERVATAISIEASMQNGFVTAQSMDDALDDVGGDPRDKKEYAEKLKKQVFSEALVSAKIDSELLSESDLNFDQPMTILYATALDRLKSGLTEDDYAQDTASKIGDSKVRSVQKFMEVFDRSATNLTAGVIVNRRN